MPRHISFALTTPQFLAGTKTVTRRLGWRLLKPGDVLVGVEKAQGLKKGEKVKKLGLIRVVEQRRERLNLMLKDRLYGIVETRLEGFPVGHKNHDPAAFVAFFCSANNVKPSAIVTRIEFERID